MYMVAAPCSHLVLGAASFSQQSPYILKGTDLLALSDQSRNSDQQQFIVVLTAAEEDSQTRRPGIAPGRDVLVQIGRTRQVLAVLHWISNRKGWNLFTCLAYPNTRGLGLDRRPGFLVAPTQLINVSAIPIPRSPRYTHLSLDMQYRFDHAKGWISGTIVFPDDRGGQKKWCTKFRIQD